MKRKLITLSRITRTGLVNFVRNAWLAIAAMAVMVVTLTIILFSWITNAAFNNTIAQIVDKIDVSVYLKDSVTPAQTQAFIKNVEALPNVKRVEYLSKDQVLQNYKDQNAGNEQVLSAASQTDNPLPATVQIYPKDLNKTQDIKDYLSKPAIAAMQSDPTSYSGDRKAAIDKISNATRILREVGIFAVVIFAIISVLIIFNTIQMAIFNRRDEITIMRLLGASTWYIRGPFVVENIVYGISSALLSVAIIKILFVVSKQALQATSLGLLDINYASRYFDTHLWLLLTAQLGIGILIGAASSIVATRRYLKFKTK